MRFFFIYILLGLSTVSFSQKSAEVNYTEGLSLAGANTPELGFKKFYAAVKEADDGTELQLNAIFKIALYYNYADEKTKPEVLKWTLRGLEQVKKTKRKDTLAANLFFRGARAYELDYQPDSALMTAKEARRRFVNLFGEQHGMVADCDLLMGNIHENAFYNFSAAENYYEKSLTIREGLKDDYMNKFMISILYSNLSIVNRNQGEYEKALAYALKDLALKEKSNLPIYLEVVYLRLGNTYREMHQFENARAFYEKAIAVNAKINKGKNNAQLGEMYFSLGENFEADSLPDKALAYYKKAAVIYKSSIILKNISYVDCLEKLGKMLIAKGQDEQGQRTFKDALLLIDQYGLGKSGQASSLLKSIGDFFSDKKQVDSAFLFYQKSLMAGSENFSSLDVKDNPALASISLKNYCYETLLRKSSLLAELFYQTGNTLYSQYAVESIMLAEKLLSYNRSELDMEDSKWNFFDSNFVLYEQAVDLIFNSQSNERLSQCFFLMESSKAKTLSEALNTAEEADAVMSSDTLIQFIASQKRNIYHLQDQLVKLRDSDKKDGEILKIRSALIQTDRKIQLAENKVIGKYPAYMTTKYKHKVPSLEDVKAYSKNQDAVIIEYFWGKNEVFALGIRQEKVILKRLGNRDSIQAKINENQKFLLSKEYSYSNETVQSFSTNSFALYQSLLLPFQEIIADEEQLIIIPDGPISHIPFEILNTSDTKSKTFNDVSFLVKTHVVSYSFSSQYLLSSRENVLSEEKMIAFELTQDMRLRSPNLEPLAGGGSEKELISLRQKFSDGRFLFGVEATEENFKAFVGDYDFLHLAVHGEGNVNANYSAALFFNHSTPNEDGKLHWYELFGMRMKARLAVISSCESGIGKEYRGEGMLSMATAFAYAGCSNIVMGLWKVDDAVSVKLMEEFYKEIREGKRVNTALAEAKRLYLDDADELSSNPKLWASLVAYGNQPVIKKNKSVQWYALILLVILMTAFVVFKLVRSKTRTG
jgi:CHAT domain-containing protein/tetratricopeptide (TPR) repeat protein